MYALGVTAYELFTGGELPWEKTASSEEVLRSVMNSTGGRDPRELCDDIDDDTAGFLLKCVESNPNDRYQNPAEFREALKEIAG
jgi:serine/threonine protein kinase